MCCGFMQISKVTTYLLYCVKFQISWLVFNSSLWVTNDKPLPSVQCLLSFVTFLHIQKNWISESECMWGGRGRWSGCVCMCWREQETERQKEKQNWIHFFVASACFSLCIFFRFRFKIFIVVWLYLKAKMKWNDSEFFC